MVHTLDTYMDGELILTTTGPAFSLYLHIGQMLHDSVVRYRLDGKGRKFSRHVARNKLQALKRAENKAALERDTKN